MTRGFQVTSTMGQRLHAADALTPPSPAASGCPNAGLDSRLAHPNTNEADMLDLDNTGFDAEIAPSWAVGTPAGVSPLPHPQKPLPGAIPTPGRGVRNNWASLPTFHRPLLPFAVMETRRSEHATVKAVVFWVGFAMVCVGAVVGLVSALRYDVATAGVALAVGVVGACVCALSCVLEAK